MLLLLVACAKEEDTATEKVPDAELTLTSPAPGGWVAVGQVNAKGTATDCEGVKVNGTDAKLADGKYSTTITLERGVNVVEATAVDGHGDTVYVRNGVLAGTFKEANGSVSDAMAVRVNQSGLDKVGDLAEGLLTAETVQAQMSAMNPVYSDSYVFDTITVNADVTTITFDTPSITFEPGNGQLTMVATIPNFNVGINAYGEVFGFDYDTSVTMSASAAVITGDITVAASGGKLGVELISTSVELQDYYFDLSALPSDVVENFAADTVRGYIEDMLVTQISEMVPPLLDETLAGLDPSFETELLGQQVSMAFSFASADIDTAGLALGLDLDVNIPSSGTHAGKGYLGADKGNADVDTHSDVAAAISDNLLNRVLYEAWDGGMLDITMSSADGSLSPLMLAPFKAEEGTISIDAQLPPVAVEKDGRLLAEVGEMVITVDTPGGELGNHLVVAVNATIGLELTLKDGSVTLALGEPQIVMMVRESDWGASNEAITALISDMLPLDTLLALLGDFSFPIPSLYGVAIDDGEVLRDADGVHTDLKVYLQ